MYLVGSQVRGTALSSVDVGTCSHTLATMLMPPSSTRHPVNELLLLLLVKRQPTRVTAAVFDWRDSWLWKLREEDMVPCSTCLMPGAVRGGSQPDQTDEGSHPNDAPTKEPPSIAGDE